jgi:glyoxylase-like metal-dependent hydrolase (beta-lactamase superfamily II)
MSRRILGLAVFGALLVLAAQSHDRPIRELAPGVFFWQGDHVLRKPANCTWVVFRDYVVVIDANFPWAAREILPEIRKTTNKPIRFLFDTHYHSDHTFGNSLFIDAGATVVCSQDCADELRTKGKASWEKFRNTPERNLEGLTLGQASLTFADRMAFDDGDHRVELIRVGPAHSKGDAVAYLPKQKILVAGDLCVNWTWGNNVADPDAHHDNWIRVLDDLARWDVKTVVPGHGTPGPREILHAQREYLADMLAQVRAGITAGQPIEALTRKIDLSRHGPLAANAAGNENSIRAMYRKLSAAPR